MWAINDKELQQDSRVILTNDLLRESYNRCEASGLSRAPNEPLHYLSDFEHSELVQKLTPVKLAMGASFYALVKVLPGEEKFCLLTDSRGYVVDICGTERILKAAAEVQISDGVLFDEASFGTTAVSLALQHRMPVYLSGDEHYCSIFHNSECLGVPLFDSHNNVFACVGIFSYLGSSLANNVVLEIVRKFLSRSSFLDEQRDGTLPMAPSLVANEQALLSRRQLQVIQLRANGYLNKQIADKLEIHLDTVKEHVSAALRRLRVRSVAEAVLLLSAQSGNSSAIYWHNRQKPTDITQV